MIRTRVKIGLFAGFIGVVLVGCTTSTGPLTQSFGRSQTMAKMNQRLNPEASANMEPVAGISSEASKRAIDKYYQTFEREEQRTRFVLPVAGN